MESVKKHRTPRARRLSARLAHTSYGIYETREGKLFFTELQDPHRHSSKLHILGEVNPNEPYSNAFSMRRVRNWENVVANITDILKKRAVLNQIKQEQYLDNLGEEAERFFRDEGFDA